LIGDRIYKDRYGTDLAGTPIFLGSSDPDPHIPVMRVHESATLLASMNANVLKRIYIGMGHTISNTELAEANAHLFGG